MRWCNRDDCAAFIWFPATPPTSVGGSLASAYVEAAGPSLISLPSRREGQRVTTGRGRALRRRLKLKNPQLQLGVLKLFTQYLRERWVLMLQPTRTPLFVFDTT